MNVGDVHNFGRKVDKIEREGKFIFRKPRPILSELFLLGQNSPIKDLILKNLKNQRSIDAWNCIFSLTGRPIFKKDDWCAGCGEVDGLIELNNQEVNDIKNSVPNYLEDFAFSFGIILGYAFVMGMKDLHGENLIISKRGLHIVDGEIGFEGIKSIFETNIIGADKPTRFMSAFGFFWVLNQKIPDFDNPIETDFCVAPNLFKEILKGFLETVDVLDSIKSDLKRLILDFLSENRSLPFRVLLRGTYEYFAFMKYGEVFQIPFIEEELIQMRRGDIPYFYSTYEDRSIFYNTDSNGSKQALNLPLFHPMWTALALKFRYDPELLLSEKRFKTLRAIGSIELMREINCEQSEMELDGTQLTKKNDMIYYNFNGVSFEGPDCKSHLDSTFHLSFGIHEN